MAYGYVFGRAKKREEVKVCRLVALLRLVLSSSAFVLRLQCCSMYHHFFWTLTYKALNRVLLCINGYTQITRGGIPGCLRSSVLYFPWLFIGSLVYPIVGNKILMKGGGSKVHDIQDAQLRLLNSVHRITKFVFFCAAVSVIPQCHVVLY